MTAAFVLLTSCNTEKLGSQLTAGINKNIEETGFRVATGAGRALADTTELRKALNHLLDSTVLNAGLSGNIAIRAIVDSLLSPRWTAFTAQLLESVTGQPLRTNLAALKDNLLGADTRQRVRMLLTSAMNEVLGDRLQTAMATLRDQLTGLPLQRNISTLRDSLLNDKTNAAIKAIVDTAMLTIAYRMKNNVNPSLQANLSFIQRNATSLLITVGIMALVVIIVIWRLKEKYAKMTTVLASQIHAIPDQQAYDDLTNRIKEKAVVAGVEPSLRKVLSDNGLLGKDSRESWQAKRKLNLN